VIKIKPMKAQNRSIKKRIKRRIELKIKKSRMGVRDKLRMPTTPLPVELVSRNERRAGRPLNVNKKTMLEFSQEIAQLTEKPLSIIISYKESYEDRKRNLRKILNFFSKYLCDDIEMIIVEQDIESKVNWLHEINNYEHIKHIFLKNDGIFNKGWGYNVGAKSARHDNLLFNDSDVLVSAQTYHIAIKLLEDYDVVNPYKYLYWLNEPETIEFASQDHIDNMILNRKIFSPSVITGGIYLIKRKRFLEIKGYDENSYGWGFQDYIFDEKIKKMGFHIHMVESTALHLHHDGSSKPGVNNPPSNDIYFSYQKRNSNIYDSYKEMSKTKILSKINNTKTFGEADIKKITISSNPKLISVVMAYYNRKQHLINTLHSMKKSEYKNFEVIVVDDGSDEEHRIEDLQKEFEFLKVHRIEKENKNYTNPSIPTNIALSQTSGDKIIIQNPECFHYGDVFNHVVKNLNKNKYLAYSTLNKDISVQLATIDWSKDYQKQIDKIIKIDVKDNSPENQWYCHKEFRPLALNFCVAITRKDLADLNGFDERYAYGIERDDIEFLDRIKRKKMQITFVKNAIVIHQSHPPFQYSQTDAKELRLKNHQLYAKTTAVENIIRANPNKIIIR